MAVLGNEDISSRAQLFQTLCDFPGRAVEVVGPAMIAEHGAYYSPSVYSYSNLQRSPLALFSNFTKAGEMFLQREGEPNHVPSMVFKWGRQAADSDVAIPDSLNANNLLYQREVVERIDDFAQHLDHLRSCSR